ncbi:putative FK506 binding protein 2 [Trypoxylus dichotomus]
MKLQCTSNNLFLIYFILLTSHYAISENKGPKRLQIGIKKRPKNCVGKSKKGDLLHVHYRGIFEDGTEFDTSYVRQVPFTFTVGSGQVIKGWDQGLIGMCIGEIRKLVIPPELGYGKHGVPPTIPGDTNMIQMLCNIELRSCSTT